jgi:hypothetical protein
MEGARVAELRMNRIIALLGLKGLEDEKPAGVPG